MERWKSHPSGWLVATMIGVTVGVALAYFVWLKLDLGVLLGLIAVLLAGLWFGRRTIWPIFISLAIGCLIGWSWATPFSQQVQIYRNLISKEAQLSGVLFDDVGQTSSGAYIYRLDQIEIYNQKIVGDILAMTRQRTTAKRGDRVYMKGVVSDGLAGYQVTLQNAEIEQVIARPSLGLTTRNFFTDNLDSHLSPLQSSLASAFLTGKRREIPADFTLNLQIVGLTHLVVASGFHLTAVVRAGKRLGEKRSRRWALFLGLLAIGLFTMITGVSSSMTRAGLVSLISLVGWYYGRRGAAGRILLLVLGLTVLINPLYLWGNASFYLSFCAFAGVLILGPILRQYFWGKRKLGFFSQLLTEALSAQIATLPISVFFFGKLSTVMLITNLLVVPVASILMLFSLLVSLFGAVPGIGVILIWPLQFMLNYVIGVTNWFAALPLAQIDLTINLWQVILAYILVVVLVIYLAWRNRHDVKLDVAFNVIE